MVVPSTAQAALAEAPVAAANLVARWNGEPMRPFRYRERGVVVALGVGRAAGKFEPGHRLGDPRPLAEDARPAGVRERDRPGAVRPRGCETAVSARRRNR